MRVGDHVCEKKTRNLSSFFLAPSNYRLLLQNIVSFALVYIYICICIQKRRENASREGERHGDRLSLQSRLHCNNSCIYSCRCSGSGSAVAVADAVADAVAVARVAVARYRDTGMGWLRLVGSLKL